MSNARSMPGDSVLGYWSCISLADLPLYLGVVQHFLFLLVPGYQKKRWGLLSRGCHPSTDNTQLRKGEDKMDLRSPAYPARKKRKERRKAGMGRWEDFSLAQQWLSNPYCWNDKGDSPGERRKESSGWSKMKAELGVRACQRYWLIIKTGLCFSHVKQQGMVKGGGCKNPVTGEGNGRHWFFWLLLICFLFLCFAFYGLVFIWRRQRKTLQNYFELNNNVKNI